MKLKQFARVVAVTCVAVALGMGSFTPGALAGGTVSISSDTSVFLSGSGITLTLAAGSSVVSYSVSATTLTLNLDSDSSVTVESRDLYTLPNSRGVPTQCPGRTESYVAFSATGSSAVTVTPSSILACATGGAGTPQTVTTTPSAVAAPAGPIISSFSASPSTVQVGQATVLSWTLIGTTGGITIVPAVAPATVHLDVPNGEATVHPSATTTYTLTAVDEWGDRTTATATVTVVQPPVSTQPGSPAAVEPAAPSTSGTPAASPPSTPPQPTPATATSTPAYCLVNNSGSFSLILNDTRHGIANPGLLSSYGYAFSDAVPDSSSYQALPTGDLLGPGDGALVKSPSSPTVYLVSGGARHGFTSIAVFRGLGFKTASVLTVPAAQLDALPVGDAISGKSAGHLSGVNVSNKGTVYLVGEGARLPYPSLAVFNTWNLRDDFSRVVPANAADLSLPFGPPVASRTNCTSQ